MFRNNLRYTFENSPVQKVEVYNFQIAHLQSVCAQMSTSSYYLPGFLMIPMYLL